MLVLFGFTWLEFKDIAHLHGIILRVGILRHNIHGVLVDDNNYRLLSNYVVKHQKTVMFYTCKCFMYKNFNLLWLWSTTIVLYKILDTPFKLFKFTVSLQFTGTKKPLWFCYWLLLLILTTYANCSQFIELEFFLRPSVNHDKGSPTGIKFYLCIIQRQLCSGHRPLRLLDIV